MDDYEQESLVAKVRRSVEIANVTAIG